LSAADTTILQPEIPRRSTAIAAMIASGLLFAIMGLCARLASLPHVVGRAIPASEVTLVRFAFGALTMLALQSVSNIRLAGTNRRGLIMRGVWGGFAVYFYFLSLHHTSLLHAQLLNYASVIFAPLFALLFLRERLGLRTAFAILIAIAGMCFITLTKQASGPLNIGDSYGLISGILSGAAIIEVRRLRQTESAWSVFFYMCAVGTPIALMTCITDPPHIPTAVGCLVLFCMAATSVVAQILMTYGYKYVRAAEGNLLTMTQIAYNGFAGVLIFHEIYTVWTFLGGALILGAAVWLSMEKK
jgi:drug/metabolite transporter (DMT)-like permease